jgi:aminoglycoside phosphotransferase (APT) family kinase protein
LKAYADEFGARVWAYARILSRRQAALGDGVCLPMHFLPHEHMLVFPWVEGARVADIVDGRAPGLLQQTAELAAALHHLPVVPEAITTPAMMLEETRDRCERVRARAPEAVPLVTSLLAALEEAATALDPAHPAPIHGDLDAGQVLWTGERLVLIDLDMFGYADPAYDAGHFLAQLERRDVPAHWLTTFRDAYLAAAPATSARNVAFYRALTLVRKIHTVCRLEPRHWPSIVPSLASRARAALGDMTEPVQTL